MAGFLPKLREESSCNYNKCINYGALELSGWERTSSLDSAFFSSSSVIPRSLIRKGRLQEDLHVVFCHGEGAHSCKQGLLVLAEGGEKRAVRVWMDKEDVHKHSRIIACHKKEWNNDIYSNVDGPRDYHTKWSKPDKDKISYKILLICCTLKNDTNELIYKTERDSQT